MRLTKYVISIMSLSVLLFSCHKEIKQANNSSIAEKSDGHFLEDINKKVFDIKANYNGGAEQPRKSSGCGGLEQLVPCPVNLSNPYEQIGINHNQFLLEVHGNPHFDGTLAGTLAAIDVVHTANFGHPLFTNKEDAVEYMKKYAALTVNENGVNPLSVLALDVPELEKGVLLAYWPAVYSTDDQYLRIQISKVFESAILENVTLSAEFKERLPTKFSIFRHSSVYWANGGTGGNSQLAQYPEHIEALDASVADACMSGELTHPDGFDISCPGVANHYGYAISGAVWTFSFL